MNEKKFPYLDLMVAILEHPDLKGRKPKDIIPGLARTFEQWKSMPPRTLPNFRFVYCNPSDQEKKLLSLPFDDVILEDFRIGIEVGGFVYLFGYFAASQEAVRQKVTNLKNHIKAKFPWIGEKRFPTDLPCIQDLIILSDRIDAKTRNELPGDLICDGRRAWVNPSSTPDVQCAGVYYDGEVDTDTSGMIYVSLVCRPAADALVVLKLDEYGAFSDEEFAILEKWQNQAAIAGTEKALQLLKQKN